MLVVGYLKTYFSHSNLALLGNSSRRGEVMPCEAEALRTVPLKTNVGYLRTKENRMRHHRAHPWTGGAHRKAGWPLSGPLGNFCSFCAPLFDELPTQSFLKKSLMKSGQKLPTCPLTGKQAKEQD